MTNPIKWRAKVEHLVACNCDWGCPCAFEARPTTGHCEGAVAHRIVTGRYGDVTLDGLKWVLLVRWPGAIHECSGRGIVYLDSRAKGHRRTALEAIVTATVRQKVPEARVIVMGLLPLQEDVAAPWRDSRSTPAWRSPPLPARKEARPPPPR